MRIILSPSKEMTMEATPTARTPLLVEEREGYRAIELYNGLQYRYLRNGLTEEDVQFLDENLRILSAKYGIVRPFDGIQPYRMDFQTKGRYAYWGSQLYEALTSESNVILNAASDEFAKTITRYQEDHVWIQNVAFYEQDETGKIYKHASISKKGRGQLVHYIARNRITELEDVKAFDENGYSFSEQSSTDQTWAFVRKRETK